MSPPGKLSAFIQIPVYMYYYADRRASCQRRYCMLPITWWFPIDRRAVCRDRRAACHRNVTDEPSVTATRPSSLFAACLWDTELSITQRDVTKVCGQSIKHGTWMLPVKVTQALPGGSRCCRHYELMQNRCHYIAPFNFDWCYGFLSCIRHRITVVTVNINKIDTKTIN